MKKLILLASITLAGTAFSQTPTAPKPRPISQPHPAVAAQPQNTGTFTPAQTERLKAIAAFIKTQTEKIKANPKLNEQQKVAELTNLMHGAKVAINEVVTPQQLAALAKQKQAQAPQR